MHHDGAPGFFIIYVYVYSSSASGEGQGAHRGAQTARPEGKRRHRMAPLVGGQQEPFVRRQQDVPGPSPSARDGLRQPQCLALRLKHRNHVGPPIGHEHTAAVPADADGGGIVFRRPHLRRQGRHGLKHVKPPRFIGQRRHGGSQLVDAPGEAPVRRKRQMTRPAPGGQSRTVFQPQLRIQQQQTVAAQIHRREKFPVGGERHLMDVRRLLPIPVRALSLENGQAARLPFQQRRAAGAIIGAPYPAAPGRQMAGLHPSGGTQLPVGPQPAVLFLGEGRQSAVSPAALRRQQQRQQLPAVHGHIHGPVGRRHLPQGQCPLLRPVQHRDAALAGAARGI